MGSDKIKILVGSKNPTKTTAVFSAFEEVFKVPVDVVGLSVSSGVPDQPMSCLETKNGAKNRVNQLQKNVADFYVGIEGGCSYEDNNLFAFAWAITVSKEKIGYGKTSLFQLPKEIQKLIEQGVELGEADDLVFNRKNSKQKDGAVGILTGGLVGRSKYYKEAVVMSLIPFINKRLNF